MGVFLEWEIKGNIDDDDDCDEGGGDDKEDDDTNVELGSETHQFGRGAHSCNKSQAGIMTMRVKMMIISLKITWGRSA